jgi:DNA-binding NarL/FixJ family response regulator
MMSGLILADDFEPVRHRLRVYLEAKGWGPCQEAAKRGGSIPLARRSRPDDVILDYSMPVRNGAESARVFHDEMPDVPIFMFTGHVSRAQRSLPGIPAVGVFSKDKIMPLVDALSKCLKEAETEPFDKKERPQPGGPRTVHCARQTLLPA